VNIRSVCGEIRVSSEWKIRKMAEKEQAKAINIMKYVMRNED
jgi:hypothetical protein